jgi:sialidase-1
VFLQENSATILGSSSVDGGATWTVPVQVSISAPAGYSYTIPAVGHGIVVNSSLCDRAPACGGTAGRLLMPFVCYAAGASGDAGARAAGVRGSANAGRALDVACPGCYSCVAYSDDAGASWTIGAVSGQQGTREAALVQLLNSAAPYPSVNAVIYASERNMGANPGYRLYAASADAGLSFAFSGSTSLPDPVTANWTGIVAGVSRFDTGTPITRRVIATVPAAVDARAALTLFVSTDETASWSAASLLYPGPAGYSDLIQFNATHAAVLYENGAAPGDFAAQISFALFDASAVQSLK